jgi:hypothetical protein
MLCCDEEDVIQEINETGLRDESCFLKVFKIESVPYVCAQVAFQIFRLPCLVEEKNKFKEFACFYLKHTNSKDCCGSRIIIFVPASLSVIGRFSPVSIPHWMQDKSG